MKKAKFLLSLALGMASLTALADTGDAITSADQITGDGYYAIKSSRCFLLYSADQPNVLATSTGSSVTDAGSQSCTASAQAYQFKTVDGAMYLYSVGASKYVDASGNYEDTPTAAVTLHETGDASYPWKIQLGDNYINTQIAGQFANGVVVNGWSETDGGNSMAILESSADDSEVVEPVDPDPEPAEVVTITDGHYYFLHNKARGMALYATSDDVLHINHGHYTKSHAFKLSLIHISEPTRPY